MESTELVTELSPPSSSFVLEASMDDVVDVEEENRFKLLNKKKPAAVVLLNAVKVKTTTIWQTSTFVTSLPASKTVFIMNCTPVPFTYPICVPHKRPH